ncbi:MAG: ABC transporter substrate-binding protein [Candidatus Tectomicrobia bacterium]|uniref:ABC transporter substrate-binding protein n=1 Tax=Tectimicrobiota bacterium TaxID=2528274 RepID=A0A938B3N1_UNCTE|nr:ABC transporter substrate-binding protein [Candidatus Tectomicrobia bacterium]
MVHAFPPGATSLTRRRLLQGSLGGAAGVLAWHQGWGPLPRAAAQKGAPSGQMTWAIHVTLAPSWLDPSETLALATPYMLLYAVHDALVKPMPGNGMTPSLATKWSESADGLTYDFELRQGVKFHNGDPFTAEDVQFSFERYKGASAVELKQKVKTVEIVNPHHIRFRLHEPWPDFMTFYGTMATGVGWIVPKRYIEKIGSEAYKNQPVGLGPYRLVSHQPGIEVVLEAHTDYWRKTPHVKRLVMKSVPEATTRLAMLKQQEADVTYGIFGSLAEDVQRDPNLKLVPITGQATQWVAFIDQHDPKSPWADARVRLAANHAINWSAINDAENLGMAKLIGGIIPAKFDFALPLEPYGYDPKKAKQLLKDAGYANGFEGGECSTDTPYAQVIEAVVNDLTAVGIRTKVRPMERAAMQTAQKEKTVKNLTRQGSGAFGNAATRIEAFMTSRGAQSFLRDAEIDA